MGWGTHHRPVPSLHTGNGFLTPHWLPTTLWWFLPPLHHHWWWMVTHLAAITPHNILHAYQDQEMEAAQLMWASYQVQHQVEKDEVEWECAVRFVLLISVWEQVDQMTFGKHPMRALVHICRCKLEDFYFWSKLYYCKTQNTHQIRTDLPSHVILSQK